MVQNLPWPEVSLKHRGLGDTAHGTPVGLPAAPPGLRGPLRPGSLPCPARLQNPTLRMPASTLRFQEMPLNVQPSEKQGERSL